MGLLLRLRFGPVVPALRRLELDSSFIAPSLMDWSLSCIVWAFSTFVGSLSLLKRTCEDNLLKISFNMPIK
jgi:hypothetical protein